MMQKRGLIIIVFDALTVVGITAFTGAAQAEEKGIRV